MSRLLFGNGIGYKLQGVRCTRVFCNRIIFEVNAARNWVKRNVLEDRPKAFGRGVDLWLGGFGEPDHFGIASPFEIKHTIVAPAMLIVTYQAAGGICRESRF